MPSFQQKSFRTSSSALRMNSEKPLKEQFKNIYGSLNPANNYTPRQDSILYVKSPLLPLVIFCTSLFWSFPRLLFSFWGAL